MGHSGGFCCADLILQLPSVWSLPWQQLLPACLYWASLHCPSTHLAILATLVLLCQIMAGVLLCQSMAGVPYGAQNGTHFKYDVTEQPAFLNASREQPQLLGDS